MLSGCRSWVRNISCFQFPDTTVPTVLCDRLIRDIGKEAGEAFERAAAVQKQHLNEPDDEANSLTEAFSKLHVSRC
jgi:hypothetical protein